MKTAELKVTLADSAPIRALVKAAGELAEVAADAAASLRASDNYETPRWVADELEDAVRDFRSAVGALIPRPHGSEYPKVDR